MLYLLENHKSLYRLYCDNRKLITKKAIPKSLIFKEPFINCNSFVIQGNQGSWGTKDTWYEIVDTFPDDNYPELFI